MTLLVKMIIYVNCLRCSLFNYTWSCGYGLHYLVAIFMEFDMDSLLLFPPHLMRSFRLVINQSVWIQWSGVYTRRSELSFRCLYSEVIIFILIRYVFKHCLLILPLFVAICEIWLLGLTYGVYLVLFLKPGATEWYQSNAGCRTQA